MSVHFYVTDAPSLRERVLCQTEPDWNLRVTNDADEVTCADCVLALVEMDR